MDPNFSLKYKDVVENIFNRWSALKLVVEHGMGDHKTAIEMMNYMYECCIANDKMDVYDVNDVLDDIMDREFDTTCDDNSTREVATMLVKYLAMCKAGQYDEVNAQFAQMPPSAKWLIPGAVLQIRTIDSSSDDDNDDAEEEMDEGSTSGAHSSKMEDDSIEEEPGWTTVRRR